MKWPIDTSAFSFMGSLPPEPVLDRQTKQQKVDVNEKPLYCMELMCFWEEGAGLLTVRFPGTPPVGLRQGAPVKVAGLVVSDCSMDSAWVGVSSRQCRTTGPGRLRGRRGMSWVPGRHAVPRS